MSQKNISTTEENYLKAIYKLSERISEISYVSTNSIADEMQTKAASVTDMVKRLSEKTLLNYVPYKGVQLSASGKTIATDLIRKHRLWEVFLVEKLDFTWAEVHPIAEQLEHIKSDELVHRLDSFLEYPKYDPHGDPIPDKDGKFRAKPDKLLSDLAINDTGIIVGVKIHSPQFLEYLDSKKLVLGTKVEITEFIEFDQSMIVKIGNQPSFNVSSKICKNLYIQMEEEV